MTDIELDKVRRLAKYLDFALAELQREARWKLAGTRAGELLGNSAAAAHELLSVLGGDPRRLGADQPTDESNTKH